MSSATRRFGLLTLIVILGTVGGRSGPAGADCGTIPIDPTSFDESDYQPANGGETDYYEDEEWDPTDDSGIDPYDDDSPREDEDASFDGDDEAWEDWSEEPAAKVAVEEPTQKAVIAWNGSEQLMVLKTELKANRPGKLLEIMPLPGRPVVTKGDEHLFNRVLHLFRTKHGLPPIVAKGPAGPGARIIEELQIGNHRIAVAQVVDPTKFVTWANRFVAQRLGNRARPNISATGRQVITQYLNEGYRYWVFDLVDVETETRPHVAIQYRFPTSFLYYPLRITRSSGVGNTQIELLVLTQAPLQYFRGVDRNQLKAQRASVVVSREELRRLSAELDAFFPGGAVQLRMWELQGPIQSFRGDLQARTQPVTARRLPEKARPRVLDRSVERVRPATLVGSFGFRNESGVALVPYQPAPSGTGQYRPDRRRSLENDAQVEIAMKGRNQIFYDDGSHRGVVLQLSQTAPYRVTALIYEFQVPPGTEGKDPARRPRLLSRQLFDVTSDRSMLLVLTQDWTLTLGDAAPRARLPAYPRNPVKGSSCRSS